MKKIAIFGAGGFGEETFCVWKDMLDHENIQFDFLGFFDDDLSKKVNSFGNVIGTLEDLNNYPECIEIAIAIGNSNHLENISKKIFNPNVIFPNIIHPSTLFFNSETINILSGNIISPFVIISSNVNIGSFNIINTRSSLAHNVNIGNFCILSPNIQLNGNVTIKDRVFLGFNSGILQNKTIESDVIIGAGSIVYRDAKEKGTYIGNPASKLKFSN